MHTLLSISLHLSPSLSFPLLCNIPHPHSLTRDSWPPLTLTLAGDVRLEAQPQHVQCDGRTRGRHQSFHSEGRRRDVNYWMTRQRVTALMGGVTALMGDVSPLLCPSHYPPNPLLRFSLTLSRYQASVAPLPRLWAEWVQPLPRQWSYWCLIVTQRVTQRVPAWVTACDCLSVGLSHSMTE